MISKSSSSSVRSGDFQMITVITCFYFTLFSPKLFRFGLWRQQKVSLVSPLGHIYGNDLTHDFLRFRGLIKGSEDQEVVSSSGLKSFSEPTRSLSCQSTAISLFPYKGCVVLLEQFQRVFWIGGV